MEQDSTSTSAFPKTVVFTLSVSEKCAKSLVLHNYVFLQSCYSCKEYLVSFRACCRVMGSDIGPEAKAMTR